LVLHLATILALGLISFKSNQSFRNGLSIELQIVHITMSDGFHGLCCFGGKTSKLVLVRRFNLLQKYLRWPVAALIFVENSD
jgi:hypothetical protein